MYQRDFPRLPLSCPRESYVREIFDLGQQHHFEYNVLYSAVIIGDDFINNKSDEVTPYHSKFNFGPEDQQLLRDPVPKTYSLELAHVSLSIATSQIDLPYPMSVVCDRLDNYYPYKMQWDICISRGFTLPRHNIMTLFAHLTMNERFKDFPSLWDLSLAICLNSQLMSLNPITIIVGVLLLHRKDRLSAEYRAAERRLQTFLEELDDYDDGL